MGKIVSNFFVSLDGVVESPEKWHFPYFNDEMGAAMRRAEQGAAFLMGRVLYEEWSKFWPQQGNDMPFASFINNVPKYVLSNTLQRADWTNTTVITGDAAPQLRQLKESTDGDIVMSGSATVTRWLLANGLLDELALMIHPIMVGHGQRLFEGGTAHPLQLIRQETFTTGVLDVAYAPA